MKTFTDLFNKFLDRMNIKIGQLVKQLQDNNIPIPRHTLNNWKRGKTQNPRHPEDILKLARVFKLSEAETSEFLRSAGHPSVDELRQNGAYTEMLSCWNIPHLELPVTPFFVGRKEEIQILTDALTVDSRPVAIIQGMGGVGKTTLAAYLAYQLKSAFPDGILWANLEQYNPMQLLNSFVSVYGEDVSTYTELADRQRVVRDILSRKKVLLVLDNVQKEAELTAFLPIGGRAAALITTRRHNLWATRFANACITLNPFDAKKQESLELFANILGETVLQESEAALVELADSLGHLPLAVEIVANRLASEPNWSIDRFLARLRQEKRRLDLLRFNDDVSVRLSLNISFETLGEESQNFLVSLGAFGGVDFSIEAAAIITHTSEFIAHDHLAKLYTLSLLQLGHGKDRYRLHPLVREFAREKLRDVTPVKRMARYYLAFAGDNKKENSQDFAVLDAEHDNLEVALTAAWEHQLVDELVSGANALCPYWERRGLYETATLHLERALEEARRREKPVALARTLHRYGRLEVRQGAYKDATNHYLEGLEIARRLKEISLICALEQSLGALAARQGLMSQAQDWTEKALARARQLSDGDRIFNLLNNLGGIMYNSGQLIQAQTLFEDALQLVGVLEGQAAASRQCVLLRNLGHLASDLGDHDLAKTYYEQGWSLASEQDDQTRLCDLLDTMGYEEYLSGDIGEAERQFKQGLKIARNMYSPLFICRHRANLGLLDTHQGLYDAAHRHFKDALQLAEDTGSNWDVCTVHNRWG
jgi:tetratricopeptide (TPR) repeat protein